MALIVSSFATYLTRDDSPWRSDDFNAFKFIQAIKGEPLNKWAWVPVGGVLRKLTQENADKAIEWFGEWASAYLAGKKLSGRIGLLPVPNKPCTVTSGRVPRTVLLAKAIADRVPNTVVLDCLRWRRLMVSARKGGTRDPQELYDNLVAICNIAKPIIIVDDVRTTGAHLRAVSAKVRSEGGQCLGAVCAGRTVLAQEKEPFSLLEEELPDFIPK